MNHLKVAYSCNDGYVMQTEISLYSLLFNNSEFEEITIYLIGKDMSAQNIRSIKEICAAFHRNFKYINFDDIAYDLKLSNIGRHIETIYTKIFFSRIPNLDRILYLDSDTVIEGSLSKLWKQNLDGYYMGMVETYTGDKAKIKLGINECSSFFNDGVALCNVNYCRNNNLIENCLKLIERFNGDPPLLSEGVLNKICLGYIFPLSPKYNMMSGLYQLIKLDSSYVASKTKYGSVELEDNAKHPIIIHYLSGFYNRPWNLYCTHPLKDIFIKYKDMTKWRDFPLSPSELPIRLKIIGYLLEKIGPRNIDKIRKIIK